MAVIRCQSCGKPNPDFLEVCQYCDARLKPLTGEAPEAAPAPAAEPAAVVRCQSCGKPNPAFLETCQFCDARLKPLEAGAAPEAESAPMDTLDRLRAVVPPEAPEPEPTFGPAPTQAEPDWLWSGVTEEQEAKTPPAEAPDWMSALRASAQPAEAEAEPDWMSALRSAEAAPPEEAAPAEEVPDWLRSMRAESEAPAPAEPEAALPDWTRAPEPSAPSAPVSPFTAPEPAPEEEIPDWLKAMRAESETPAPAEPEAALPDWMRAPEPSAPEPVAPPAGQPAPVLPDWLSAAGGEEAPAIPSPDEDVPDWLKAMRAESEAPAPAEPSALPDWLGAPGGAEPFAPEPAAPVLPSEPPAEELPDWLKSMQGETAAPAFTVPEAAGEEPDWLRSVQDTGAPAAPAASPFAAEAEPGGEPDWLASLRGAEAAPEEPSAPPLAPEPGGAEPDWLAALRDTSTPPPAEAVSPFTDQLPEAPETETAGGPMPDWLAAMRPGDLSSALAGIAPTVPAVRAAPPLIGEEAEGLAQTALPSWLEALRPVDVGQSQIPREQDAYEETVGVLAGMRGVLRAEPTVAQPRRSTTQVHQLEVSELHASQMELLKRLLAEEAEPKPAARRRAALALPVERLIVFALMAAALLLPLAMGPGLFPLPAAIGPETLAAYNQIQIIPASRPALVAFDYEPAQAGELNPGAKALVGHLMRRGVPIVAVSTRLTGPALADDVLNQLNAELKVNYVYGTHYLNLGYVPGGPVGLQQFAAQPRSSFSKDFTGATEVWASPLLTPVTALNDFSAILLITSTPDGARAWVEQTRAAAASVPMLAVVSAGAEPLVRPYYESNPRQISGLVSGLRAAAQYEQQAGAPGAASARWDTLGAGLLGAAALVLAGSLINTALAFTRRRKK
jgi:hypothetical protein